MSSRRAERGSVVAPWVLAVALLYGARPAFAEEEQVHLRLSAPDDCASAASFAAQVAARTAKARWVERSEGVRMFDVAVSEQTDRWQGQVRIRDRAGIWSSRAITGESCDELVDALALVTALAIDPQADTSSSAGAARSALDIEPALETPLPAAPELWPGFAAAPSARATRSVDLTALPLPSAALALPPGSPDHPSSWRWGDGLQVLAASGLGPGLSAVAAVFVDVSARSEDVLSPSFRLALSYLPNRVIDVEAGQAKFWRFAVHPSACPIGAELHPTVWFRPCIGMEVGVLHGAGRVQPFREADTLWLAAALAARLELNPVPWSIIEIQGELGVPFVRPDFYFEPDATIATVRPVYGTVGGALGVRFP